MIWFILFLALLVGWTYVPQARRLQKVRLLRAQEQEAKRKEEAQKWIEANPVQQTIVDGYIQSRIEEEQMDLRELKRKSEEMDQLATIPCDYDTLH